MPNIAVCFKYVIDEADIKVDAATLSLKTDRVDHKISDFDRNAIEAGTQLVEALGGTLAAVTVGGTEAKAGFKDALARGADRGVSVCEDSLKAIEPPVTAKVLAAALNETGPYDLILFGEGSSDIYAQQVGPRVAEIMGLPVITFVNKITVADNQVIAERKLEDGVEVVSCPLPVAVTVVPDINKPRVPGMKQILAAKKKEVKEYKLSDLNLDQAMVRTFTAETRVKAAVMDRKQVRFEGELQEAVRDLVGAIIREGAL